MHTVKLACRAMATRFELMMHGEKPVALRAAGEEAFAEIERLEAQLSLYRPSSEIAHLNAHAARGPVQVEPRLFQLLLHARRLSIETDGAFDITVAPLMRCWGFLGGEGRMADPVALAAARECVGMRLVELDESAGTVRFAKSGVMLDLGSIGKGYALERAVEILIDAGVTTALLHGGTSTVCALGSPPDATSWRVAIPHPRLSVTRIGGLTELTERAAPDEKPLAVVELRDESLSVSAVWGKAFANGEMVYGHVIDPRTGHPVREAVAAAVVARSATESDALSTALLTLGPPGLEKISQLRTSLKALIVSRSGTAGGFTTAGSGIEVLHNLAASEETRTLHAARE